MALMYLLAVSITNFSRCFLKLKSAAFEEHGEHGLAEGLTGKGAGRPLDTDMVFLILQKIVEASAQSHRRGGLMGSKVNPSTGRGGAGRQRKGSTQDELFQHYEELGHIHKGKVRAYCCLFPGYIDDNVGVTVGFTFGNVCAF